MIHSSILLLTCNRREEAVELVQVERFRVDENLVRYLALSSSAEVDSRLPIFIFFSTERFFHRRQSLRLAFLI